VVKMEAPEILRCLKSRSKLLSVTILCLSQLIDETINETRAQWQAQARDERAFVEVDHWLIWIDQMLR
jgi:hypothetical protein